MTTLTAIAVGAAFSLLASLKAEDYKNDDAPAEKKS